MASSLAKKPEILRVFSDQHLAPSEKYSTSGRIAANEILNVLRKFTPYVDRVKIGGSMGKCTAVMLDEGDRPDFDIVF